MKCGRLLQNYSAAQTELFHPGGRIMAQQQTNNEAMNRSFATISKDASLKEAYVAMKKNLEGPPHSPGLVVIDAAGKYAGLVTMDDFMKELARLHRAACDKPGRPEWLSTFFSTCEIVGFKKVAEIMSGKRLWVQSGDSFEPACELIHYKKAHLLAVVDDASKPVGIITRRQVLEEIAPRLFK
jgi:predicted transcriptional regulator